MYNVLDEYKLIGKEIRTCKKIYTEIRYGKEYTFSEPITETIGYFSYKSQQIDGEGVLIIYIEENLISYNELEIGKRYRLSFNNSKYLTSILDLDEYYEDLAKESEYFKNYN